MFVLLLIAYGKHPKDAIVKLYKIYYKPVKKFIYQFAKFCLEKKKVLQ